MSETETPIAGLLLMVACFGHLIDGLTFSLFPNFDMVVSALTFIGELLLMSWLLIKGVNVEWWQARAESAPMAAMPTR